MRSPMSWPVAFALLAAASPSPAQSVPDRVEVAVKFSQGRLVADRGTARLILSDRYRLLLRPGVTEDQLKTQFCDALDREFRLMPKPYFFTLTSAERNLDLQNRLTGADIEAMRNWNMELGRFPRLGILATDRDNTVGGMSFNGLVERVTEHSSLGKWDNPEDDFNKPLRFAIRDPLNVDAVSIPATATVLNPTRVRELLRPLAGRPANPEQISDILLDFSSPRGLTPKITAKLDGMPPEISIFDASRIQRLLLPADLIDLSMAQRIAYNALPNRLFKAFRRGGQTELARAIDPKATKRDIDLAALVSRTEQSGGSFELPPVDAVVLSDIQQRVMLLGFTASLFDSDPARQLLDLVIDATTPQPGAAAESNAVTGTTDAPPNAPAIAPRPNAGANLHPDPLVATPAVNPSQAANTARRAQKTFIGAGIEFRPGQGIRGLGSFQRKNTFGLDLTRVEAGGMGEGFGTWQYSRDYVLFDAIGRRLTVDATGGSEFNRQRVLSGVLTDERRNGGAVRAELEAFRDGPGHQLNLIVGGRRESVALTPAEGGDPERDVRRKTLTAFDAGVDYRWRRSLAAHPVSVRIEPALRVGLPISGEPAFTCFTVGTQYHQSVAGPVEAESRFQLRHATDQTPVFELPSLGGMESVRGFRADERVGHTLWASQNELWLPVLRGGAPSGFRDFVRRNVRLAGLYDLGQVTGPVSGIAEPAGFRHGAGIGLRIRYQGVVIETDWARGFGNADTGRPGHGQFYFNFRLP
jgi:hypothetical protein